MGAFDVVVLDGTSPAKIGGGRFVLVNSTPGDVPIESLGTMEQPVVLDWARNHPVMRFVDLSKVAVEEALRVRPLAAGKTLLESVGGPAHLPARGAAAEGRLRRLRPLQDGSCRCGSRSR